MSKTGEILSPHAVLLGPEHTEAIDAWQAACLVDADWYGAARERRMDLEPRTYRFMTRVVAGQSSSLAASQDLAFALDAQPKSEEALVVNGTNMESAPMVGALVHAVNGTSFEREALSTVDYDKARKARGEIDLGQYQRLVTERATQGLMSFDAYVEQYDVSVPFLFASMVRLSLVEETQLNLNLTSLAINVLDRSSDRVKTEFGIREWFGEVGQDLSNMRAMRRHTDPIDHFLANCALFAKAAEKVQQVHVGGRPFGPDELSMDRAETIRGMYIMLVARQQDMREDVAQILQTLSPNPDPELLEIVQSTRVIPEMATVPKKARTYTKTAPKALDRAAEAQQGAGAAYVERINTWTARPDEVDDKFARLQEVIAGAAGKDVSLVRAGELIGVTNRALERLSKPGATVEAVQEAMMDDLMAEEVWLEQEGLTGRRWRDVTPLAKRFDVLRANWGMFEPTFRANTNRTPAEMDLVRRVISLE